jgi:Ankyrin repeat
VALLLAAENGKDRVVRLLLESGAHVDTKDKRGCVEITRMIVIDMIKCAA